MLWHTRPVTRQASRVRAYFGLPPATFGLPPAAGTRLADRTTSWRILRANRYFRRYFIGSVTSDLGTWFQNTAQVLLAYRLSHSVLVVGLVTCAQFTSPLVLSAFAGVATSRLGGRRTLFGTQIVAAVFAALISAGIFLGPITGWELTAGAVASGLAFTFALPARNVTVRRLVIREDEESAFSLDSVSYNLGRAVAPPLCVLLVTTAGFGWAFALNAVSFAIFAVCIALAGRGSNKGWSLAEKEPRKASKIWDGVRVAFNDWEIGIALLMVAAVTIADDPILVLGPSVARGQGADPYWAGLFIAALGAGTVIGSFRPSRHTASLRKAATALAALALCMVLFVQSPWAWASMVAAVGAGASCLVANSTTKTLLTRKTTSALEASVMAVWAIAWAGSKPVASLCDGLLANWAGIRWTGFLLAIPALIPFLVLIALLLIVYATRALARWKTFQEWLFRANIHLTASGIITHSRELQMEQELQFSSISTQCT